MKRVISGILCAAFMLASLAGCGAPAEPSGAESSSMEQSSGSSMSEASSSEAVPAAEGKSKEQIKADFLKKADEVKVDENTVTFVDGSQKEITVNKDPKNAVSLYGSLTTLWYEAGGKLSGTIGGESTVALYEQYIGRDITKDEGVKVLANSSSGKKWDVESIIATKPDLIICSMAMSGYATIKEPATAASIPVIAVEYNDFSDYLKWFKVFCNLNGNEELWDSVAMKALDDVADVISMTHSGEKPKVFSMLSGSKSLQANTSNTVLGGMITELGAENIVDLWENKDKAERLEINLETVVAADPDIILVQCHADGETAQDQVKEIYGSNEVWNSLRAVKEGKIFYLEKALFHNKPNSKFAEAYKVLSDILYSEKQ